MIAICIKLIFRGHSKGNLEFIAMHLRRKQNYEWMRYFSGLKRSVEVQRCGEHIVSTRAHYPRVTMLGTADETYQKAWSLFAGEADNRAVKVTAVCLQ